VISVLTCATRGRYLAGTIASIDRAGGREYDGIKVIHVDGPAAEIPRFPGWDVHSVAHVRAGARRAMLEIMRRAAAWQAEPLLYFEDDVLLCRNAIRAMLEIGVPEPLGYVAYCDLNWAAPRPLELVAFPGCPHNGPVADGGFVGCQALTIPWRTSRRLSTTPAPRWIGRNGCDETIGTSSAVYGVIDSLAEHVGAYSAIIARKYPLLRTARGWRGEDFDADQIPRRWTLNRVGERCSFHAGALHEPERVACSQTSDQHRAWLAMPAVD
jgi:hypothetical protein